MLHAIAKGKTKFYRRYLGKRDDDERRVCEEDEITSTVFGPMDFLPAADVYDFWCQVLHSSGHKAFMPNTPASNVKIDLWPRRNFQDEGSSIEPDGLINLAFPDGTQRHLLLELKWRAPLSGDDQLHRQWKYFLNRTEQAQALHLFIAPEISAGAYAPNNEGAGGDVWKDGSRLVLLPWLRIRAILGEIAKENSALGRWAKLSDQFLARLEIRRFSGFTQLAVPCTVPAVNASYLLWNPYNFTGWAACGETPVLPILISSPLFFDTTQDRHDD